MVRMTTFKLSLAMALSLLGAFSLWAAEIRGRVTDPQGAAIPSVAVIAQPDGSSAVHSAQTDAEGGYLLSELPPGRYLLRAQKAGYTEQRQGPLDVTPNGAAVVVNFRLAPGGEAETVRGAEERNPNDFVMRLDTNSITNEMMRVGFSPRLLTEFRAERSFYGEPFGYPLRTVESATPGRVLGAFHGAFYEFHQNHTLNARPFFQVGSLLPSRRNQYGFSVTGPIVKERLSFHFAWGQVRDSGFVNGNIQVPLATERAARSSDPQINAIVNSLLRAFPAQLPNLPHVSVRHLNTNDLRDIRNTAFSVHLDAQFPSGDRLAVDQQFLNSVEEPFELVIGQNPRTSTRPQSVRVTYSRSFSPQTVGQLNLNYDRLGTVLAETKGYSSLLAPLGIPKTPIIKLGEELSDIGITGQGIPRVRYENHYMLAPQVSHTRGRHAMAAGFSVMHLRDSDLRSQNGNGFYEFSNDFSATAVENFLLGRPSRFQINVGDQYRGFRNWEYNAFFNDRFQARQNLTLNFGLRYEAVTVPTEVHNRTRFFYDTDANNFAPQFGFAWKPAWTDTVVRGGYGIAFGTLRVATYFRQVGNPPEVQAVSLSAREADLRDVRNLASLAPDPSKPSSVNLANPGLALPYSHLYNLILEKQLPAEVLFRIGYQGSRTIKMYTSFKGNRARPVPGIPATSATVNERRPDQSIRRVFDLANGSTGYFDALQISASKRRSRGLAFEARYSFSKAMETALYNFADAGNGGEDSQTEDVRPDVRGLSAFDTPHSFALTYSYEVPAFQYGPRWLAQALARWTVSGTTTFRSGTPFAVLTGSDSPGFGNVDGENLDRPNLLDPAVLGRSFDDPDTSPSLMGADTCEEVKVAVPSYIQCRYFDTNIPAGGRGNIGYRVFRKDGTNNWNLALARSFLLPGAGSEKQLQFRAEFFNFFNHAQFSAPGISISSPTFGQITNTVNKGRVTQLTLRFLF